MPNYVAYRRSVRGLNAKHKSTFGSCMLAMTIVDPSGRTRGSTADAYAVPFIKRTHLGSRAARNLGFLGNNSIKISVKSPTYRMELEIEPAGIIEDPNLPADFICIGWNTIEKYFKPDGLPRQDDPIPNRLNLVSNGISPCI